MKIDTNSPIPLYFQLKQELLRMLEDNQIETGSRLPSEKELAAEAGLSRFTVRQALDELQREGWLEKQQGRGTFASKPKVPLSIAFRLVGFSEDMSRKGYRVSSRVIDSRLVTPSKEVAKALALRPGKPAIFIQRLRGVNGQPFLVDNVYVSPDLCPGLESIDLTDASLIRVMETRYRRPIVRAHRTLTIATAEAWVAKLLGVARGSSLYRLTDLMHIASGEPIQYAHTLITEDRCEFVFDLVKSAGARKDSPLTFNNSTNPTPKRKGMKK